MAVILAEGKQQYTDSAGAPLAGGQLWTYAAGTTTPQATYSDSAGTVPNTNPVTLDARGEAVIYWAALPYKVVLKDAAGSTIWTVDNVTSGLEELASTATGKGAALVGAIQPRTGAVARTVASKLGDTVSTDDFGTAGDGTTPDTAALAAAVATAAKVASTTQLLVPLGVYPTSAQISLTGYNNISGYGDTSQIKVTTASISGIAYTSQSGVFDDHPHNALRDFRVTGDGVFAAYPGAQTGTTTGLNFAAVSSIGNFAQTVGMTYDLHNIGKYVKNSYVHSSGWNHYRGNKIGLKLEEVTSYTEIGSYFRHNSTAAVQIIGGQNITIQDGAIEGNAGVGLQYISGSSAWGQINLRNVYFESNGNEAAGIWSIDVPPGSQTMVNVTGGNLWRNVASGVASGPYRLGDNAVIDSTTLNGSIYAKNLRVRNTRGTPSYNTFTVEATARLFGLVEPVMMLEYSPARQEYSFAGNTGGQVFQIPMRGRGSGKIPGRTNLLSQTYPYGLGVVAAATSAANSSLNWGEGDFFQATFAASVGGFSSNAVTIAAYPDISKPYRVCSIIMFPTSDCEIAIVQSVGGQSVFTNHALLANTYYQFVIMAFNTMSAGSTMRVYPINANGPVINFFPVWSSQHTTHVEQLDTVAKLYATQTENTLTGTAIFNPPSIAAGASTTTTVTVTGAALGDMIGGVSFSLDMQGLTKDAYVSAADTVTVRFSNPTAGAIDLGSGTLKVRVDKL